MTKTNKVTSFLGLIVVGVAGYIGYNKYIKKPHTEETGVDKSTNTEIIKVGDKDVIIPDNDYVDGFKEEMTGGLPTPLSLKKKVLNPQTGNYELVDIVINPGPAQKEDGGNLPDGSLFPHRMGKPQLNGVFGSQAIRNRRNR